MISINKITMTIDQSMRRFGISEVQLALSVSDRTPSHEHEPEPESGPNWAEPLVRYAYKAQLYGYGRDGTPSRKNAEQLSRFELVVNERQLVCRHFPRFHCGFETRQRILDIQRFTSMAGSVSANNVVMLGQVSLTAALDMLDVDNGVQFQFHNSELIIPKTDVLFCKVQIVDLKHNQTVVANGESNSFSDFFGRDERRTGTGDDREEPVRPITIP